jgi:hypothetical protein
MHCFGGGVVVVVVVVVAVAAAAVVVVDCISGILNNDLACLSVPLYTRFASR